MSLLKTEFNFLDVVSQDSHVRGYTEVQNDFSYQQNGINPYIYFRNVDQSDPLIQQQMMAFVDDVTDMDEVSNGPAQFWLPALREFVVDNKLESMDFNVQLLEFLNDDVMNRMYANDIVLNDDLEIKASRTLFRMDRVDPREVNNQVKAQLSQEEVSAAQPLNDESEAWSFFTFSTM